MYRYKGGRCHICGSPLVYRKTSELIKKGYIPFNLLCDIRKSDVFFKCEECGDLTWSSILNPYVVEIKEDKK